MNGGAYALMSSWIVADSAPPSRAFRRFKQACRVFVNELKLYRGLEVFREILSRGRANSPPAMPAPAAGGLRASLVSCSTPVFGCGMLLSGFRSSAALPAVVSVEENEVGRAE